MTKISTKMARFGLMTALPAVIGMAVLPPAWAQQAVNSAGANNGALEEVVVTAQKRKQNLQKTSLAVSAVSGEAINEQGLTSAAAVLRDVPNVVIQRTARGQAVAIRGLGSDLPPGVGESAVSTTTDNIYNYRSESATLGFYDLARVEILRGPQSTLYGRNATGGAMNVITANPTFDKLSGYTTGEIGNYNLKRVETVLNVPISDKWAARLAYANIDRKGFSTNGGNDAVASGFRAKALYKDGDDLSVLLGYEHNILGGKGNQGTKLADFSAGNYYYSAGSTDIRQDYTADKYYAEVTARMGPGNLTFLPAYQYGEGYVCDDMMGLDCNWDPKSSPQTSVDLRYSSLSDSAVQWATGLYYYSLKNHSTMTGPGGVKGDSRTKTDSVSIYGQATFPLAESLRGIAGLRSGNDKKSYSNPLSSVASDSAKYTSVDYKLGLEYDVAKDSMAYVTLASGHRPGGFNSLPGATNHSFEAEKLSSLEIGSKNRFMGGKIQLNGAAYYYDYSNFQYTDFVITPSGPEFTITNVAKVRNMGLELEGKARIAENTLLTGSIAALRSTYASPSFVHADPFSPAVDLNGKVMPHAPKLTLKAGIEQNFDFSNGGTLTAKLDVRHISDQFVAIFPGEDQTQKAYSEVDASLLYRPGSDTWSVNFYGRNLTNKVAKMALFGDEIFAGTPRMYGVSLTVKY